MTDYRCMFSTSDRSRKLNQLRWQNMSALLTNEISYWLKKFLIHVNWAIYVCDLNIDPRGCFFPILSQGRAQPSTVSPARSLSATQREACMHSLTTQKPKGYPGWICERCIIFYQWNAFTLTMLDYLCINIQTKYSLVYSIIFFSKLANVHEYNSRMHPQNMCMYVSKEQLGSNSEATRKQKTLLRCSFLELYSW